MQPQSSGSLRLLTSKERHMTGLLALLTREAQRPRSHTGGQALASQPSQLLLERLNANSSSGAADGQSSSVPSRGIVTAPAVLGRQPVGEDAVVEAPRTLTCEPTMPSSPSTPVESRFHPTQDNSPDTQSAADTLPALRESPQANDVSRATAAAPSAPSLELLVAATSNAERWRDASTPLQAPSANAPRNREEFTTSEGRAPSAGDNAEDFASSSGPLVPQMLTSGRSTVSVSHHYLDGSLRGIDSKPAAQASIGPPSPCATAAMSDVCTPATETAGNGEPHEHSTLKRRLRLQERELDYLRGRIRHLQSYDAQASSSPLETESHAFDHSSISDRHDGSMLSRRLVRWLEMTSSHAGGSAPPALILAGFELLHGILDSGAWEAHEHNGARSQFSVVKILHKVLAMNHSGWPAHVQAQVHEKAFELARHICHQLSTSQSRASAAWLLACQHVLEILGSGRANDVVNLLAQQVRALVEKLAEQQTGVSATADAGIQQRGHEGLSVV